MRILGFSEMGPKLSNSSFTTFRFPRRDKRDWAVGEVVQIVHKPRSKERKALGVAEIIAKSLVAIHGGINGIPMLTEEEAKEDGFDCRMIMRSWLDYTYGARRVLCEPMSKLTLAWRRTGDNGISAQ